MQITNTQKGPRGLNTKAGSILIEPGESVDVELEAAELKVAKSTDWFSFGKDALDHDNDGKKGGAAAPKADEAKA